MTGETSTEGEATSMEAAGVTEIEISREKAGYRCLRHLSFNVTFTRSIFSFAVLSAHPLRRPIATSEIIPVIPEAAETRRGTAGELPPGTEGRGGGAGPGTGGGCGIGSRGPSTAISPETGETPHVTHQYLTEGPSPDLYRLSHVCRSKDRAGGGEKYSKKDGDRE